MKRLAPTLLLAALVILAAVTYFGKQRMAEASGLTLPAGFKASVFAEGFAQPRFMAVAANGDVFLSDMGAGKVVVLRDTGGGITEAPKTFASGLNAPHGLAFRDGYLYVANTDAVLRFSYKEGDTEAQGPPETLVKLPAGGHASRTIVFGPDGRMYVSVGSTGNADEETDPLRAAVWSYDADGKNGTLFALGLRNSVGIAFAGGALYATSNGVDHLGDDLPREALFRLKPQGFHGWPYCYVTEAAKPQAYDASIGKKTPAICATAEMPIATFDAHAAPLGLAHYTGTQFPAEYRGKLFVAQHGSWVPAKKVGYKVVTVDPATGQVADFLTGFLNGEAVSGRPVDLVMMKDGSLLLSDDGAGRVWRISYDH